MAYDGRVYRILIASPSDVEEERDIVTSAIQAWNDLNSALRRVVLLPLRWETHSAPEYGTRPQEVINRQIVDECDLLVGIFWTRIGSPTGIADSGTLEEIERVGKAGKPIMLYFSRVEIDPERIDTTQIEQLKAFKQKTYPVGLVEHYRTRNEFRDKFSQQLERKVRDLHESETSGSPPLSLKLLSLENHEPVDGTLDLTYLQQTVTDFKGIPADQLEEVKKLVKRKIRSRSYVPFAIALENVGPTSIRNLFVELIFSSDNKQLKLDQYLDNSAALRYNQLFRTGLEVAPNDEMAEKLSKYDLNKLQSTPNGWTISLEWDAIQPNRLRPVRPIISVSSPSSANLTIKARIYSDFLAKPFETAAFVKLDVKSTNVKAADMAPNWAKEIREHSQIGQIFSQFNVSA